MKKLATLLLAAAMVLGSVAGAQAIDWKVRGLWTMEFGVYDGLTFSKHTLATQRTDREAGANSRKRQYGAGLGSGDTFQAAHRINLQLQAVASEYLSGSLHFEIGSVQWGQRGGYANHGFGHRQVGGALGERAPSVGVREAYID